MDSLKLDQFARLEGETFDVSAGDYAVPLKLEKAEALEWSGPRDDQGFRIEWSGPLTDPLPQGTFHFRHGEQSFEIFIVPIARSETEMRYEAIFN
jgi:hypothetical protein